MRSLFPPLLIAICGLPLCSQVLPAAPSFARLEKESGGRLGIAVLDLQSGKRLEYRAQERFPLCSTFKFLLVGAVLSRVDKKQESLDRTLRISKADLLSYAPVTGKFVNKDLNLEQLCAAVLHKSDNTAANLLLKTVDGPQGVTQFARTLGDTTTRLDRNEPSLNVSQPNDPRDTTTPAAMLMDMKKLLVDGTLSNASRTRLETWMAACETGHSRLRQGFPNAWRMGDKTGSGDAIANDIAIIYPPGRSPVLITAYLTECKLPPEKRDAVLAEVGRMVASMLP